MNKKYLNKNFYKTPAIRKMQSGVRQIGRERLRQQVKNLGRNGK
jgi:hypothetical protein